MDKFREWTHPRDTLPDNVIDLDRLLANVMMYWLTGTAASAAYVGYAQKAPRGETKTNSGVPTAAIVFAHDVAIRRYAILLNLMLSMIAGLQGAILLISSEVALHTYENTTQLTDLLQKLDALTTEIHGLICIPAPD